MNIDPGGSGITLNCKDVVFKAPVARDAVIASLQSVIVTTSEERMDSELETLGGGLKTRRGLIEISYDNCTAARDHRHFTFD